MPSWPQLPTLQSVPPHDGCPTTPHAPLLQNPPQPQDESFDNVVQAKRFFETSHLWQP
jgi:hypothetical protein